MFFSPFWRYFITGKTQSGKSTFAKWLLRQFANIIVFDIKGEYLDMGVRVSSVQELDGALRQGHARVIYHTGRASDMEEVFPSLCEYIFSRVRNVVFVVDEIHRYVTKSIIPSAFKDIVTIGQGEQYRIGVIALTQRPQNVHNDVISSASVRISFRLDLPADARAVAAFMRCDPETLQTLQYYHSLIYSDREEPSLRHLEPILA